MITQQVLNVPKSAKAQATQQLQQAGQQAAAATNGFVDLLSSAGSALTDLSQDKGNAIRSAVSAAGNDVHKRDKKSDANVTPYIQAVQTTPVPVLKVGAVANGLNALTKDNPVLPALAATDATLTAAQALLGKAATGVATAANDATALATGSADAAANAAASAANGTNPSATPNANTTILGADALNARIAAGAPVFTAQANAAMSAVPAHLLEAQDPHTQFGPATPEVPGLAGSEPGKAPTALPAQPLAPASTLAQPLDLQASANHQETTAVAGSFAGGNADNAADQQKSDKDSDGDSSNNAQTSLLSAQPTQAQSAPVQANAVVHTTAPYVPVGEQIAASVKQAVANNDNEIHLELKPAALGAINVKLNFGHDGRITAVISADRSDTLNMLKQDQGNLQQALRDAGINADSSSLSFNLRGDAQSFAQNSSGGNGQNGQRGGYQTGADDSSLTAAAPTSRAHSGTLNIEV